MAIISITGMEFHSYHGCFKEEQLIGNTFVVDIHVETNTTEAEIEDNLHKTINYASVYSLVKSEMEVTSKLIEHVAKRILDSVMASYPQIDSAEIKVSKLNPPVGGKVEKVSVTLNYERKIEAS
jgi:7,8-dihydroneopterin aldolase/epimerase/oxygenase